MHKHKTAGSLSVFWALLGNLAIATIKFIGYILSGSSTLLSEAIHSLADTMNQSLLMVGIKRSVRKADHEHSYGYGQERFLWALISACGIFFLGAGVTIVNGINAIRHPESVIIEPVIYLILLASFFIELFTFLIAIRELKKSYPELDWSERLKDGDPTTIAVIFEDGVALLGVLVALASIWLYKITGNYLWDGIGSIVIGIMLTVVAVVLIRKNRDFLMHKAIPEDVQEKILDILEAEPVVERVVDFKSTILDVGAYHIKCEIEINGSALFKEMKLNLKNEFDDINGNYEEFKKFAVRYIDRVPRLVGERINKIEQRIQEDVPNVIHIDIEIN
ncbi:MAG: cation diffusion facilitator family transporter [bacterium]